MKKLAFMILAGFAAAASAQVYVAPHVTKNGTYVQGHVRSAPNSTTADNYSTQGNFNPYTGAQGSVAPSYQAPSYQAPVRQQQCGYTSTGRYICQ